MQLLQFLVECGAELNCHNNYGRTPLWIASINGHLEIARCLVEGGAEVNKDDYSKQTPLWAACAYGHLEVAQWLVEEGAAELNKARLDGSTALMTAAKQRNFDIVRFLASAGARLTDPANQVWQSEQAQRALIQGCQDRQRLLLFPVLREALLLPVGQRGLLPELLPFVLGYALPATWEEITEIDHSPYCVCRGPDDGSTMV